MPGFQPTTVYQLLLLYDHVRMACRNPTHSNWRTVSRSASAVCDDSSHHSQPAATLAGPGINAKPVIPAIWTVSVACADAEKGGLVECIRWEDGQRLYAEIQDLVTVDCWEALFTAKVLGQDQGMSSTRSHIEY